MLFDGLRHDRPPFIDAAGRIRVGQLTTLGDLKTLVSDDSLIWENAGTGTFQFQSNKMLMSVTAGQWCVRNSKHIFPYFSGKSQLPGFTFDTFAPQAGVIKRVGYFSSSIISPYDSDFDGYFIESSNQEIVFKLYNAGRLVYSVPLPQWAFNDLIENYNWDNFTVMLTDFLWLGGANISIWLKYLDSLLEVVRLDYAGTEPDVFMNSPNQPIRYEIRSTGGSGSMRAICAEVSTEGSTEESGKQRSVNTGHIAINLPNVGTKYPLLAIRKSLANRTKTIKQIGVGAFVSSNTDQVLITLELNPVISAPFSWSAVANSGAESAIGDGIKTVIAAGTTLFSEHLVQNVVLPPNILDKDYLSSLGVKLDGTSDVLCVCATPITSTVGIFSSMSYKEY